MRNRTVAFSAFIALALTPVNSVAQTPTQAPAVLDNLLECRKITDSAKRLACYDQDSQRVEDAQKSGELIAVDRETLELEQKKNFGLSMPSLPSLNLPDFGLGQDGPENAVILTIAEYKIRPNGTVRFTMSDGQIWDTVSGRMNRVPRGKGQKLYIRNASLGSFLAQVNNTGPGLRVRRVK